MTHSSSRDSERVLSFSLTTSEKAERRRGGCGESERCEENVSAIEIQREREREIQRYRERWGVVSQSLFNGSDKTHPPSRAEQRGRGDPERANLQPATEESIPPVSMVTEPSAGEASERTSQKDELYRKKGGLEGKAGEGRCLTLAIILIIPLPTGSSLQAKSCPSLSSSVLEHAHCNSSVSACCLR